jgi:heme o synthase
MTMAAEEDDKASFKGGQAPPEPAPLLLCADSSAFKGGQAPSEPVPFLQPDSSSVAKRRGPFGEVPVPLSHSAAMHGAGTGSAGACPLGETFGALFLLAKPGIVAAVTLSGFTGMVLARRGIPPLVTALPCIASLLLMGASSALINNILDRRMDAQMARLSARTAALKLVGTGNALLAATTLCLASLAVASTLLNPLVALLLVAAAASYTVYYTLCLKRHTHWAAAFGGVPGAFPVLIGHAAVTARPDAAALALFLIMLVWQPPHFWLLSLCHCPEYRSAGVPVLPAVKGEPFTRRCIYLGVTALLPAPLLLWLTGPCSGSYALSASALGAAYLFACHHFMTAAANYRAAFRISIVYLLLLFTLIIGDLSR